MEKKKTFHLKPKDRENFKYQAFSLITEIKKELNRLVADRDIKRITSKELYYFLAYRGYVQEQRINGSLVWIPTQAGRDKGIAVVDKKSTFATNFEVLLYPTEVQQEVVEHYIRIGESKYPDDNESD